MKNKYNKHYLLCPALAEAMSTQDWQIEADTTNLQLTSLLLFASALNYKMNVDYSFERIDWKRSLVRNDWDDTKFLSFEDMLALHNSKGVCHWTEVYRYKRLRIDLGTMSKACRQKLVERCFLQRNKRMGVLVAQKHLVKLV